MNDHEGSMLDDMAVLKNGDVYDYDGQSWIYFTNVKGKDGTDGTHIYLNGDDTSNAQVNDIRIIDGVISSWTGTEWVVKENIRGSRIETTQETNPDNVPLAPVDDILIDKSGNLYQATSESWEFVTNLRGPSGTSDGSSIRVDTYKCPGNGGKTSAGIVFNDLVSRGIYDYVTAPFGGGANIAQLPDGTQTHGICRGECATDFQKQRTQGWQVASGKNSCLVGGNANAAQGEGSGVLCGRNSIVNINSSDSFVGSGDGNKIYNFIYSSILCGKNNTMGDPQQTSSSTIQSSIILTGQNNIVTHGSCVVSGNYLNSTISGQVLFGQYNQDKSHYTPSVDAKTNPILGTPQGTPNSETLFVLANGNENNPKNVFVVTKDGDVYIRGGLFYIDTTRGGDGGLTIENYCNQGNDTKNEFANRVNDLENEVIALKQENQSLKERLSRIEKILMMR